MLGIKKYEIADHEKALLFRKNSFKKILEPGRSWFVDPLNELRAETHDCDQPKFQHKLAKFLLRTYPQLKEDHFDDYELSDAELGLCYIDGKLADVLPPGTYHVFWKQPAQVKIERLDISRDLESAGDLCD